MLLLVGPSWSVDGEVVLSSDNPIVDHVGLRRIFVAGPDDHLPSRIVDPGPDWSIDSMNLTLDAGVVSSEPSEGVHVGPDLLVHEVDVLLDDVVKGLRHNGLQGLTTSLSSRGERMRGDGLLQRAVRCLTPYTVMNHDRPLLLEIGQALHPRHPNRT
jgi:hypothetical protein